MSIELLQKRYGIQDPDIDIILTGMLTGQKLVDIAKKMNAELTPEQIYAIARQLSLSQFGESIEFIAPNLVIEREEISIPLKPVWAKQREDFLAVKKQQRIEQDLQLSERERVAKEKATE